jgi:hypothetical protein
MSAFDDFWNAVVEIAPNSQGEYLGASTVAAVRAAMELIYNLKDTNPEANELITKLDLRADTGLTINGLW